MKQDQFEPLAGWTVVITRPVGQGRALMRGVRALGGCAIHLPGLSLQPLPEVSAARLRAAREGDFLLFTSPAAVGFAARLGPLAGHARCAGVGRGTARALRRQGVPDPLYPRGSQDAAGLLDEPELARVRGARITVIGAEGGRERLQQTLRERGAQVSDLHVYRRVPARLGARHRALARGMAAPGVVVLTSLASLRALRAFLAADWSCLAAHPAIVSSVRLEKAAREAGFVVVHVAHSALGADLISALRQLSSRPAGCGGTDALPSR